MATSAARSNPPTALCVQCVQSKKKVRNVQNIQQKKYNGTNIHNIIYIMYYCYYYHYYHYYCEVHGITETKCCGKTPERKQKNKQEYIAPHDTYCIQYKMV